MSSIQGHRALRILSEAGILVCEIVDFEVHRFRGFEIQTC